mgnify:FL=1
MNPAYEPLFTPFSIRNTRIKNRYFMAAMGTVAPTMDVHAIAQSR